MVRQDLHSSEASVIALIPCRSGSKRVPNKNVRLLGGKPLLQYTIEAAKESGIFARVMVSTESRDYGRLALELGADVWIERPAEYARDDSPDFEWVEQALELYPYDCFSILRPTSPFRTAETIRRAWAEFSSRMDECDSLRAVERVKQHPGKMWRIHEGYLKPYSEQGVIKGQPYHSSPTQQLPPVWVQNASLEIAWTRVLAQCGNITGYRIIPFVTQGYEGFDINDEHDWLIAESIGGRLPAHDLIRPRYGFSALEV